MSDFVDQIQRYLRSTDLNFADCISKFMYGALSVRFLSLPEYSGLQPTPKKTHN